LVRRNFASALAHVVKLAAPKNTRLMLNGLIEKFKNSSEESTREAIAVAFKEMLRVASTQIRQFDKELVPFLYFAKNDPAESVRAPFKDAWNDVGAGSVRLYLGEAVELIRSAMGSASWTTKQQAGQTLSSLATDLGKALAPHAVDIVKLLREGLAGKTYKGKEALLGALSSVCSATSSDLLSHPDFNARDLIMAVLAECKRTDREYKRHAVVCLASVLKTFPSVDVYDDVFAILRELVQEKDEKEKEKDKEKDEEDAKSRPLMLLTRAAAFEALGYAFAAASPATKKATFTPLCDLLTSQYPLNPWNVQIALLGSVRAIVKSINSGPESFAGSGEVQKLVEILFLGTENVKYSVVRNAALEAFCDLVQATKDTELLNPYVDKILAQLDSLGKDNAVQLMADNLRQLLDAHPLKKKPKTG